MLYNYFDNKTISKNCYHEDTKQDTLRYYTRRKKYLNYNIKNNIKLNISKSSLLTLEYASNKDLQIKMFKLLKFRLKQKAKIILRNNINN